MINSGDLKVVVCENYAQMTSDFHFYMEKDGKRFYAKQVNLEFEERELGSNSLPTISIHTDIFKTQIENRLRPNAQDALLKQKQEDKNEHIKNLNQIVSELITAVKR